MSLTGEKETMRDTLENNIREKMTDSEDPKFNYKGWKAMPYIIGKQKKPCTSYVFNSLSKSLHISLGVCFNMNFVSLICIIGRE